METIKKDFKLTTNSVDEISDLVTEFCMTVKADKKDMLRYRLSVEECLLHWLEKGDEGHSVVLILGKRMMVPFIKVEEQGAASNPYANRLADKTDAYGNFADSILVGLGLNPEYSYERGANVVSYRLKRKEPGQITKLCISVVAAVLIGALGMVLLPDGVRETVLGGAIVPLYNTFFKILSCIAGPMIFMSVAWGIYGMGDTATLSRVGKTLMFRFLSITFLASLFATIYFPFIGPGLSDRSGGSGQLSSIVELVLGVFPQNIVEPFQTSNTLQIIFLAFVIGLAMLFLGGQTRSVARAIEQTNVLVQFLMGLVSRLVPYVIFLVIINMIWSGTISSLASVWKYILALLIGIVICVSATFIYTSMKQGVSIVELIRLSMPTYLIALATASSAAAFSTMVETCEKKFGIDKSLVRFGIPLGIVMSKPCTAINDMLLVFYFAEKYDVECSVGWIVTAVFVSAMLAVSVPPIPGGATIAYSMLYAQMGIPNEALAITIAIDVITDFIVTASCMTIDQLTLLNVASSLGMVDEKVMSVLKAK